MARPVCTCHGGYHPCPACREWQAQHPQHVLRGRPPTAQAQLWALLAPPGTWHDVRALHRALGHTRQRLYQLLRVFLDRGVVQRRGHRPYYEYALREDR